MLPSCRSANQRQGQYRLCLGTPTRWYASTQRQLGSIDTAAHAAGEDELDIDLKDRTVTLGPGELFVVPRGVEHRPAARRGEVRMLLIEPRGTPNTGDERTAAPKIAI